MQSRPAVTILDIAREAKVSRTTVSAALGSTGRVSGATREHVRAVATQLGYAPNQAARNLRRSRTGAIGLHLPEKVTGLAYYMDFTFGVVDRANEDDVAVVLTSSSAHSSALTAKITDGIVAVDLIDGDPIIGDLESRNIPLVTGEHGRQAVGRNGGTVWSDHRSSMLELLDHLYLRGSRRPAFLGPGKSSDWGRSLHRGYLEWCTRHGVQPNAADLAFNATAADTREKSLKLLRVDPRPDAIVCAPDGSAIGVLTAAAECGLTPGEDLLVASCVDSSVMQMASPQITSIELSPREMGRRCADMLMRLIQEPGTGPWDKEHPTMLNVRASTRPI
ncbi:LacI family DNA-binding transcriptional regulator [Pseudarthrobacter sp. O4]|uniref:LacI family DNA-binding transcriptional regulator n=1 Tax=Pseudarthrobacter sp. O4 TaxID=3418417 RepID=UPI003CEF8DBE